MSNGRLWSSERETVKLPEAYSSSLAYTVSSLMTEGECKACVTTLCCWISWLTFVPQASSNLQQRLDSNHLNRYLFSLSLSFLKLLSYLPSLQQFPKDYRSNERVILRSKTLARLIFDRLAPYHHSFIQLLYYLISFPAF